jgi:hypothetical protein
LTTGQEKQNCNKEGANNVERNCNTENNKLDFKQFMEIFVGLFVVRNGLIDPKNGHYSGSQIKERTKRKGVINN